MPAGMMPPGAMPGTMPGTGQPQEAGRALVPPIPQTAPLGSAQDLQNKLKGQRRPQPINQQGQGGGGNRR